MAAEFGRCPTCDVPLVLTCEFRALSAEDLETLLDGSDYSARLKSST
jgi:hypothetical protein